MPKFPAHKVKIQKLEHVLDVPKYQGNENKYLKINSDGTSPELSSVAEDVQDIVGSMLVDNTQAGVLSTYNDELDKIDFSIQTDNSTIQINNENKLEIKDLGINTIKVADNAITKEKINQDIAGTGLLQDASGSIAINDAFLQSEISANNDVSTNTSARHTHDNKAVIDLLSDAAGDLYYNGSPVGTDYNQSLDTTDDVTFNSVNSVDGYKIGSTLIYNYDSVSNNINIGNQAGELAFGTGNTNIGYQAGKILPGINCVFIGLIAGRNSTGSNNVGIGPQTLENTTGSSNVAIGELSIKDGSAGSSRNTAIGAYTGFSLTSGSDNCLIGYRTGYSLNTGNSNALIGTYAGNSLTTGTDNICIGKSANRNGNCDSSVCLGSYSGYNNSGNYNLFIGDNAGRNNLTGTNNIFIGAQAGYNSLSSQNTYIGSLAGKNNINGDRNISIGFQAGENETTSDKLYIANNAANPWIYGDKDSADYRIGINTTSLTEILTVNGNISITSGNVLKINGTQIITSQQSAISNLAGSATLTDVINKINSILAMLRTHGLIAP